MFFAADAFDRFRSHESFGFPRRSIGVYPYTEKPCNIFVGLSLI